MNKLAYTLFAVLIATPVYAQSTTCTTRQHREWTGYYEYGGVNNPLRKTYDTVTTTECNDNIIPFPPNNYLRSPKINNDWDAEG